MTDEPTEREVSELNARRSGPESIWWSYRLLNRLVSSAGTSLAVHRNLAVECLCDLIRFDPDWMARIGVHEGPVGHRYAGLLTGEGLEVALDAVGEVGTDLMHRTRASILYCALRWNSKKAGVDSWTMLWQQLLGISESARDEDWMKQALDASARVDYTAFRSLAIRKLENASSFEMGMFLPEAISAVFSAKHWQSYDEWSEAWRRLDPAFRSSYSECMILNMEGIRALDRGDLAAVHATMSVLVEQARHEEFLSNDEVSRFTKATRAKGLESELCDEFESLVKQLDWRHKS